MTLSCPKCQTNYTGSCCGDPSQPCPRCGFDEETLYLSPAVCFVPIEEEAGC